MWSFNIHVVILSKFQKHWWLIEIYFRSSIDLILITVAIIINSLVNWPSVNSEPCYENTSTGTGSTDARTYRRLYFDYLKAYRYSFKKSSYVKCFVLTNRRTTLRDAHNTAFSAVRRRKRKLWRKLCCVHFDLNFSLITIFSNHM